MNYPLNYSTFIPDPEPHSDTWNTQGGGLTCQCMGPRSITNDGGKHQRCYTCGQEWHAGVGVIDHRIKQPLHTSGPNPSMGLKNRVDIAPYNGYVAPSPPYAPSKIIGGLTCGHNNPLVTKDGKKHLKCLTCGEEWHHEKNNNTCFNDLTGIEGAAKRQALRNYGNFVGFE